MNTTVHSLAAAAPDLPEKSGTVELPAQEWPLSPGARTIRIHLCYPGENQSLDGITSETGLMLSLHNWGGTGFIGTADPAFLAQKYNVVAIGVDYLQSGPWPDQSPYPYDFGWMQALDALRALSFVYHSLIEASMTFARDRIFSAGGSGGGNVALMAAKFAPHTFSVVVDMEGMKRLTDEAAFGLPGGCAIDARYSKDPASPRYLSPDAQIIRDLADPDQIAQMKAHGCPGKIITVHGVSDDSCLFEDALEHALQMRAAGLDHTLIPVDDAKLDGTAFLSTGHGVGDRTLIVDIAAGEFLQPTGPRSIRAREPNDFDRQSQICYRTQDGSWMVDYRKCFPEGRFEADHAAAPRN